MSEKLFVAYCTSGLGNRLRPLAAAIAYCQLTGRQLRVYWDSITPNGCLTPLERLFEDHFTPITLDAIAALGDRSVGLFTEKGPGHGVQREADRFGRGQLLQLAQRKAPLHAQALGLDDPNDVVIVYDNDYLPCVPRERSIAALRAMRPRADIRRKVRSQAAALGLTLDTPGVHARGTDFGLKDALAMYGNLVRERVGSQPFFLSTEDAELEQGLRAMFPGQLRSRNDRLHLTLNDGKTGWGDPDSYTISADHGVDALVDIYLLSSVTLQVYHPGSTFAEISRHLHGVLQAEQPGAYDRARDLFLARATQLLPRTAAQGGAAFPLEIETGPHGPRPPEHTAPAFLYWETLGYRIPLIERLYGGGGAAPRQVWDADLFSQLARWHFDEMPAEVLRKLCPGPEAHPQVRKMRGYITGRKVLIVGAQTYWLELLCAQAGAAEVTTVADGEIQWTGALSCKTALRTLTRDQFIAQLDVHAGRYDLVMSYGEIAHAGLGRSGERITPLADLFTFMLMAQAMKPTGMCAAGVPTGQDLVHFDTHRIYGELRIRALAHVSGLKYLGHVQPDDAMLATDPVEALRAGWTLPALAQLPLGSHRQMVLCFGAQDHDPSRYGRDA
jgi:Caenorhabditis protein of unknown function, DUF268